MKKKIMILVILIIILLTGFLILNKGEKEKLEKDSCKIETFTLTDNGTEIEVSIDSKEYVDRININLYDSTNKKIKTIEKKIGKKIKSNELIKIKENKQYTETNTVKCTTYIIN